MVARTFLVVAFFVCSSVLACPKGMTDKISIDETMEVGHRIYLGKFNKEVTFEVRMNISHTGSHFHLHFVTYGWIFVDIELPPVKYAVIPKYELESTYNHQVYLKFVEGSISPTRIFGTICCDDCLEGPSEFVKIFLYVISAFFGILLVCSFCCCAAGGAPIASIVGSFGRGNKRTDVDIELRKPFFL